MAGLTRPMTHRRSFRLLGPPASLVTTKGTTFSTAPLRVRAPRAAPPQRRLARWRAEGAGRHQPVLPPPRSHTQAGSLFGIAVAAALQSGQPDACAETPSEGCTGLRGRASPGDLPPRLTLYSLSQSSSLSCIDRKDSLETSFLRFSAIARFSARPRSERWRRGGDQSVAYAGPRGTWREGCYLPERLRARRLFPSSPAGGTWQGLGSRAGGALSHRRSASSAAPQFPDSPAAAQSPGHKYPGDC